MICLTPQLSLPVYLHTNVGPPALPVTASPTWSASHCLAAHPLCPSCLSPSLLPVWMNVSSLTPWLSDFHTVRVFVSSGCFLFLNLCCPSFCCAKRHSVSTYPSICLEVHCVYINAQRITILFLISIKYSVVCNIHNLCIIPY